MFPHKVKLIVTHLRVRVRSFIVVSIMHIIFSPLLVLFYALPGKTKCFRSDDPIDSPVAAYNAWYDWFRLWLYSFIPCMIMIPINICICVRLLKTFKQRKQMRGQGQKGGDQNMRGVTAMLVLTSVMFVVITLPFPLISTIYTYYYNVPGDMFYPLYVLLRVLFGRGPMLQDLNHAINFILYC